MAKSTWDHYGITEPPTQVAKPLDAEKAALKEAKLHSSAPEWAVLMQQQLMQRMECIEKHIDDTLKPLAQSLELARENQGNSKTGDNTAEKQ